MSVNGGAEFDAEAVAAAAVAAAEATAAATSAAANISKSSDRKISMIEEKIRQYESKPLVGLIHNPIARVLTPNDSFSEASFSSLAGTYIVSISVRKKRNTINFCE